MLNEPEGYIDQTRVIRALLLDIVADYKRLSEEKLRLFIDPLEMWVYELFRRPLPHDWRDRLADYLAYWELDEGYTLSPESTRILNHAIEALAKGRGLLSAGDASGSRSEPAARPSVIKAPVAIQWPSEPVAPTKSPPQSDWPKTSPEQRARNQANAESAAQMSAPANAEDPKWEHRFELFGRIARDRLLKFFQELAVEGRMARDIGDPKQADLEPLFVQQQWVDQAYFGYLQARIDIYREWTRYLRLGRFGIGISILALLEKIERELIPRIEGLASPRDSFLSKARQESFEAFAKVKAGLDRADAVLVWTDRAIIPIVTLAGAVTQAAQQASAAALAEGLSPTAAHRIGLAAAVSHAAASEMAGSSDSLVVVGDLIPPAVQDSGLDERAIRAGLAVFLTLATLRDVTSLRKLAASSELPYNDGRNQAVPASKNPIALAAADAEKKQPAGRSKTNAADPSGLISSVDIQYIPGRVSITLLRDPQPFTPEPGAGGILSSQMQFFARPIAGAFTNRQGCKVCDRIGFVQITSSRLDIRGSTITSIYWIGQLLNGNRSMHVDGTVPYEGHSIDPTSNRELQFVDQPGGYNGHYWDGTTVTLVKQDFEVHVVCLAGLEKGVTYGGVMWGHQFTLTAGAGATINDYRVNRWQQRWDQANNIFKNLVGRGL